MSGEGDLFSLHAGPQPSTPSLLPVAARVGNIHCRRLLDAVEARERPHGVLHEVLGHLGEPGNLTFYLSELAVKVLQVPRQGAHSDLDLRYVAPLRTTYELPARVGKTLQLHSPSSFMVEEIEDVQGLFHGQADLCEQVLHDDALVCHLQLGHRDLASSPAVGLHEDVRQVLDGLLACCSRVLLRAPVGHLRRSQCVLDDDAHNHVHEAEGSQQQEYYKEEAHERLAVDDVPNDVVAPGIQCHHLEEGEHGAGHVTKVLVVRPDLPVVGRADVVGDVVLPDGDCHDNCCSIQDAEDDHAHPRQGLH
mmetsp:Transcript_73055/g.165696  ORF Transcript_73055/g.165696 Transcript_73055/m.165696 type:complete len:306 (+) Transcript_73055:214-1131(+)